MEQVNYEALTRPFPADAIKQRRGVGGKMLSYVETHSVIRRLVEATQNRYEFRVTSMTETDDLVCAHVEMTIDGCVRQHVGTARRAGPTDDDAAKAAVSDGIKKCATLWGVGLELYGPDYEAEHPAESKPRPQATAQKPPQSHQDKAEQASEPKRVSEANSGNPASEKQVALIKKLSKSSAWDGVPEQRAEFCLEVVGRHWTFDDLSKAEASTLIEALMAADATYHAEQDEAKLAQAEDQAGGDPFENE